MVVPLQKVGSYVLLTRPPLITFWQAKKHSYDLHVLSIPPAFILSQDQTLREIIFHISYNTESRLCGQTNVPLLKHHIQKEYLMTSISTSIKLYLSNLNSIDIDLNV